MKPLDRIIAKIRPKESAPAPRGETLVKPPPRIPEPQVTWAETLTFSEWVFYMATHKKTDDPAFIAAIEFFGRDYLRKLYKNELDKRKARE